MTAHPAVRLRRPEWLVVGAVLSGAAVVTLSLPWSDDEFVLSAAVRLTMAALGLVLLVVVAVLPRGSTRGVVPLLGVLGGCLVAYPSWLSMSAAGIGGPVVETLASGWHVLPLTLVQLAPVAARTRVLGRRGRGWELAVVAVALLSTATVVPALLGGPDVAMWTAISTALFVGSFALPPVATWIGVSRTRGETRRRATLAAVASMVPVVIIVGCTALGTLAVGIGAGEDLAISTLLLGMTVGALLCGLAVAATTAPPGSALLRTRVVVLALDGLIGSIVLIAGMVVAVLLPTGTVAPGWALLAGGALVAALILPWLRLHAWLSRVLDPSAELRHELALVGAIGEGRQRHTMLLVLRQLLDDPDLQLVFRVDADHWVGVEGQDDQVPDASGVTLVTRDGQPSVVGRPSGPDSAARLRALGDLSPLLAAAALEAVAEHEAARAEAAAENERRQVERDLHDGLQGRLLGLALNLQLSGRDVEDPTTRLLLEETVTALRSTVADVRALGSGRQPELLARAGLAPALSSLFQHVQPVVALDVSARRFPAVVETTAYFVVGEAVTNALKHAQARHVTVRIRPEGSTLSVTVSDDGRGGADPRLGSGLRALAERVAATNGVLVVREGVPSGTVVEAVVPCAS